MSMRYLQVTLGAAATQISASTIRCKEVVFENNAGNVMHLGDTTVSATRGISLAANGVPASVLKLGPHDAYALDLQSFWVFGTANDKLDIIYII